jgi:FAD synthetase
MARARHAEQGVPRKAARDDRRRAGRARSQEGLPARPPEAAEAAAIRVFVAGTFDGIHLGHVSLLTFARRRGLRLAERLRRPGVHLTVVIARDESVRRIKGRLPLHNERERRRLVQTLDTVDATFVGYRGDFLRSVRRVRPDLIVLGYDQNARWEATLRRAGIAARVLRAAPYDGERLKSSRLRSDFTKGET